MSVLSRPLFRQAGGPAQPMPQDIGQEIQRVATQLNQLSTMIAVEPNMREKKQIMEAVQKLSETTPPEIFQAAQKLVQDAKASESPNVMVNPNMDPGNRSFVSPVNRANGGEMMAPPMPPMAAEQMMANAPPPEMAMLEQAEAGATAQGQELGAAYAEQMMAGIDGAQSTEDLINALRGNDKPLDARRDELAGLVGKADANQTPESVLAMVQPVIMMTEEGMMDSGIGALVQQITGDVEMTTADGAPTEMGMGVGSLMAAGAQEAPAPQNFRQGGEVAHLQDGSNPVDTAPAMSFSPLELEKLLSGRFSALASENVMSFGDAVKGRYEDLLPLYQEILGADQESKDATKAQMLFDVAQGGLQLAAGVPGVGSSFASQFAGAAAPVAGRIQERGAALEQERRGIKQGALSGAIRQAEREMDFQQEMDIANARAGRTKPNFKMVTDLTTGQKMYVDVNTSEGASVVQSATAANATSPTGNLFAVNTLSSESLKNAKSFLVNGEPVISFDGGRTYTGEDGLDMEMPNSAIPLSDENAANILSTVGKRSKALRELQEMLGTGSEDDIVQASVKAGTADAPVALTDADRSALFFCIGRKPKRSSSRS